VPDGTIVFDDRGLVADLVQLRPIVEDPDRELLLELPGALLELVAHSPPEPDLETV